MKNVAVNDKKTRDCQSDSVKRHGSRPYWKTRATLPICAKPARV